MRNKIYALVLWKYGDIEPDYEVVSWYKNREKAENKAKEMNKINKLPVQDHGYGPVAGIDYTVEEFIRNVRI